MTFPIITHIDDVLPAIAGRNEFVVAKRDGYQVIDYNFALADSFDDPLRLECRGVKFAPDGRILARPLHKFFNIGERADTQPHLLDFSQPHAVTEKLDGSMIHPAIVDDEVVFMTRMGRTDVARKAERHLATWRQRALRRYLDEGWTPIFEFTAPDSRIVVRYGASELTLLAVRNNVTGEYDENRMRGASSVLLLPITKHHRSDWNDGQAFLDYARAVQGMEGFVVRFADGTWVKAKGEDYVLKHRAKDSVLQEKNVLALILSGELDDVLPLLDADDRGRVERYRDDVEMGLSAHERNLASFVASGAHLDQKAFAVEHLRTTPTANRPLAFAVRAGKNPREAIGTMLSKNLSSQSAVDSVRHLHGATWPL